MNQATVLSLVPESQTSSWSLGLSLHQLQQPTKARHVTLSVTAGEPGNSALPGGRKPDMTIKLEPPPQPPAAAAPNRGTLKAEPAAPVPVKKPGQLFLPQPSTVKNAYLLMAQNK